VAIYCEVVATVGGCNSTLEKRKWEGELNEIIAVTISNDGTVQVLVKNTREGLLHDFQYFLQESKQHDPNAAESMFLHARFLRAALLTLFAYAEAVVNGWVHAFAASTCRPSLFMPHLGLCRSERCRRRGRSLESG
jgi:hypothetical protein